MIEINDELREKAANNVASKPVSKIFPEAAGKIRRGICGMPGCERSVNEVRDELSLREYLISGICQDCQDEFFGRR